MHSPNLGGIPASQRRGITVRLDAKLLKLMVTSDLKKLLELVSDEVKIYRQVIQLLVL